MKAAMAATPAFVVDMDKLDANLTALQTLKQAADCKIIYAVKALPLMAVLEKVFQSLDGFSVSSLFEAKLAREISGDGGVHLTTPGLRRHEFTEIAGLCSHISFNSLSQFQGLHAVANGYSAGLRINPKLSLVVDDRYNPCRRYSKLGADIAELSGDLLAQLSGLHVHNVFSSVNVNDFKQSVQCLLPLLERQRHLQWLNLGGGYLFSEMTDLAIVSSLIRQLQQDFGVQVILEPGKAVVGNTGFLITSVVDAFNSDGKTVLVLDASVNHHPEVFEYQKSPKLYEAAADAAAATAILAGSTCLAGDIFGEYRFHKMPEIGDKLIFEDLGAYSLIKANRFNGYNLPDIYLLRQGALSLIKHYDYADFYWQWR